MHNWPLDMHPNAEFFSVGIFNFHKKKRIDTRIEKDWKWHPIRIQLLLRLSIVIQITSGRFSMHFSNRNLLCHVSQPQPKMVELQNTFSDALYSFCHPYNWIRWCWELFGKENIPESEKHSHSWDLREKDYWGYQKQKIVLCIPT